MANLPPVLGGQCRRPGPGAGDAVACQQSWSAGTRRVLANHALEVLRPDVEVEAVNAPDEVARACRPAVEAWRGKDVRPVLVLNGGQKLTPIGLLAALGGAASRRALRRQPAGRAAHLRRQPGTAGRGASVWPASLRPADILLASGHVLFGNSSARRRCRRSAGRADRGGQGDATAARVPTRPSCTPPITPGPPPAPRRRTGFLTAVSPHCCLRSD